MNKGWRILFLILLLICNCFGIVAFIMFFTNKNREGYEKENLNSVVLPANGSHSWDIIGCADADACQDKCEVQGECLILEKKDVKWLEDYKALAIPVGLRDRKMCWQDVLCDKVDKFACSGGTEHHEFKKVINKWPYWAWIIDYAKDNNYEDTWEILNQTVFK